MSKTTSLPTTTHHEFYHCTSENAALFSVNAGIPPYDALCVASNFLDNATSSLLANEHPDEAAINWIRFSKAVIESMIAAIEASRDKS